MPKILIIDDDKHTRRLFETLFQQDQRVARFGCAIVQAGDGEEGLQVFDAQRPDLVVTDLLMPRMDGFKFCAAMRGRDHGKDTGLIVVSGVYRDASINKRVKDEFGGVFFTKPYQIKDVVGAAEKLLTAKLPKLAAASAPSAAAKAAQTGSHAALVGEAAAVTAPMPALDSAPAQAASARDGDFRTVPLSRILIDLYEERATGTLELRRGRIEKRIDVVIGHPNAVSSNQRHAMLGHFLVARGLITETQHQLALQRAHDEGEKLGEALIEQGVMTNGDLVRHLTAQARFKITGALRWPDGAWSFKPNRDLLDRAKGNALDPVAVVFLGLKKTASVDDAARAVAGVMNRKIAFTPRGERLKGAFARVFGDVLVNLLADKPTTEELATAQVEPAVFLPAVEALLATGCAEPAGAPATVPPKPTADPIGLGQLLSAQRKVAAPAPPTPALAPAAALTARPAEAAPATATPSPRPPSSPPVNLYDELFGDDPSFVGPAPAPPPALYDPGEALGDGTPVAPLLGMDSRVVDTAARTRPAPVVREDDESARAREDLLEEYLRVQGKDWYGVLEVPRECTSDDVEQAYRAHATQFALEHFAKYDLGRDYAKLEELHASYRQAHEVLGSEGLKATYDRHLAKGAARPSSDALRAELEFREGERAAAAGDLRGSLDHFHAALAATPDVADYHAALGWSLYQLSTAAGDQPGDDAIAGLNDALGHLDLALAIDPDHAPAHEYLGRLLETGGDDERAIPYLERALAAIPPRLDALPALDRARTRRREFGPLERQYRKLIHRLGRTEKGILIKLWLALADVYRTRLGDRASAITAYQCAARLAPDDPSILDGLAELSAGDASRFAEHAEALRSRWRLDPGAPQPLVALFHAAQQAGQNDAAFVTAAVLVARGAAGQDEDALYRRFRPRFLARARAPLGEHLAALRHPDDDPDLAAVFAQLEPVFDAVAPLGLADLEIDQNAILAPSEVPEAFARVCDYVAAALGVAVPQVARHPGFGDQVHVGGTRERLLLAGQEALVSTDRVALAFHIGRAMTYLLPGRTTGGSRPSRQLKQALTAAMSPIGAAPDDAAMAALRAGIGALPLDARQRLQAGVDRLTRERAAVNLSRWARALARTSGRVGLLVCGDPAVAARGAAAAGGDEAALDVLDHALSRAHLDARAALGLSIDV